ncbi:Origin recognition complex subunit Orp3 [Schizosaccharomyces pombe]
MSAILQYDSVSKGTYSVKPKPTESLGNEFSEGLFVPLIGGKEPIEYVKLRENLCTKVLNELEEITTHTTYDSNARVLRQLCEHASEPVDETGLLRTAIVCDKSSNSMHLKFYEQLKDDMEKIGWKNFVVLNLKAHRDLKSCFRVIKGGSFGLGVLSYDIEKLDEKTVLVLEDVEDCDRRLLSSLVEALSSLVRRSKLQGCLYTIFNLKIPLEMFDTSLDSKFLSNVKTKVFNMKASTEILESLFTSIEESLSLKFGWRTRRFFRSMFYERSWSVERVIECIRYSILTHFYGNALSIIEHLIYQKDFHLISPLHLTTLRTVPSFQRHIEQRLEIGDLESINYVEKMLNDDTYFQEMVIQMCENLLYRERLLRTQAKIWHELEMAVKTTTRISFADYLETFLQGDWLSSPQYKSICQAILRMNSTKALACLDYLNENIFTGNQTMKCLEIHQELSELIRNSSTNYLEPVEVRMQNYSGTKHTRKVVESGFDKSIIDFSNILKKIVGLLDEEVQYGCLGTESIDMYPFYEVLFYDYCRPLNQAFASGHQRSVIHSSCMDPEYYVGDEKKIDSEFSNAEKDGKDSISWLPDLSILYKLYSESGALLNLYDWYIAFSEHLQAGKENLKEDDNHPRESPQGNLQRELNELDEDKRKLEEAKLQSRFLFGLEELRFLGLIKPTARKTDHVMKTIYHQ